MLRNLRWVYALYLGIMLAFLILLSQRCWANYQHVKNHYTTLFTTISEALDNYPLNVPGLLESPGFQQSLQATFESHSHTRSLEIFDLSRTSLLQFNETLPPLRWPEPLALAKSYHILERNRKIVVYEYVYWTYEQWISLFINYSLVFLFVFLFHLLFIILTKKAQSLAPPPKKHLEEVQQALETFEEKPPAPPHANPRGDSPSIKEKNTSNQHQ